MSKRLAFRWFGVLVTAACVLALVAGRAAASPLFDLTGDPMGMGGLQGRVVPSGAAAAYFNPALLSDAPAGLHVGFLVLSQQIAITLDGRPGTEFAVPAKISNAGRSDASRFDNYPIPTNDLQFGREETPLSPGFDARPRQGAGTGHEAFTYVGFGLVLKLFEERLSLGVHGFVPNGEFTRLSAFFNDEREQYFSNSLHPELYGDRMTAPSMAFGAGVRVVDELSLGVGTTLSLAAKMGAPTYVVDTGDLEKILIDLNGGVNVSLSPHFGVDWTPTERLRFAATAHAPRRVALDVDFTFLLANGVEQAAGVPFVLNYAPWQFGLGASYDVVHGEDQTLTVAATLAYAAWSSYIDRHGDRPTPAYPWADVLSPTLGVRYRVGALSTLADVAFTPTPVPAQTGRTNYVDNDRISGALGSEYGFRVLGSDMNVGVQLQAHHLLDRHQAKLPTPTRPDGTNLAPELVKDEVPDDAQLSGEPIEGAAGLQTNNPGWPGFGSQGWLVSASAYLKVML